jgi:hypothetical protein
MRPSRMLKTLSSQGRRNDPHFGPLDFRKGHGGYCRVSTKVKSAKTGCNICGVHKKEFAGKGTCRLELSRKGKPLKNNVSPVIG